MSAVPRTGTKKPNPTTISDLPSQTFKEIAKFVQMEDLPSFNRTFHKLSGKSLTPVSQIKSVNTSQMKNQIFNNALVKSLRVEYTIYDLEHYKDIKASLRLKTAEVYNYKLAVYRKTWPNMFRFLLTVINKLPMESVSLPPPLENNINFSDMLFKGGLYDPTIIFSVSSSKVSFSLFKRSPDKPSLRHGFSSPLGVNLQDNPDPVSYLPNIFMTFVSLIMFLESKSDLTDMRFENNHIELNTPYLKRGSPNWMGENDTEIEYMNQILIDIADESVLTRFYEKPIQWLVEGRSQQYTKSKEKYTHNNREYVVYYGSRGGRYIKVKGTYRYLPRMSDR